MDIRSVNARAVTLCALVAPLLTACGGSGPSASSTPPANTAASGIAYEAHIAAGGKPPAGNVLTAPKGADAAVAKAGEALFTAMNCDGCHGGGGSGWIAPSLADGRWRYGGADEEIYSSIYYGRPKGMPAFGGVLDAGGVWNLVAYLKSLPPPPDEPTEAWE